MQITDAAHYGDDNDPMIMTSILQKVLRIKTFVIGKITNCLNSRPSMLAAVGNLPHNANCYQLRKASIQESGGLAEATGLRAVPIFRQVVM